MLVGAMIDYVHEEGWFTIAPAYAPQDEDGEVTYGDLFMRETGAEAGVLAMKILSDVEDGFIIATQRALAKDPGLKKVDE